MASLVDKRIALITGAAGGIGEITALKLAPSGFHVIVQGRSDTSCVEMER